MANENSKTTKFSGQVYFKPWVGSHFGENRSGLVPGENVRLLVLGESHYGDVTAYESIHLIQRCAIKPEGGPGQRYITQASQALCGSRWNDTDLSNDEVSALWQDVAFYNYVQSPVEAARKSPTAEAFLESFPAFKEVVTKLRPTHVWVHGHRLWNHLPWDSFKELESPICSGKPVENGIYRFGNVSALTFPTYHPSAGFSMARWHEVIQHFLKKRTD